MQTLKQSNRFWSCSTHPLYNQRDGLK